MKKLILLSTCVFLLTLLLSTCATQKAAVSSDSIVLDEAIGNAAGYFIQQMPNQARLALVSFDAPSGQLSDYILEEMWTRFEDSKKFVMVDRRNLERIEAEIKHQYGANRVDDNAMVSISRQIGAQYLVYGQMIPLGSEYRITVYAIDVEKAVSSQRAFNVRPDNRLSSLMKVSAEEEVQRAVKEMARNVDKKTTIAIGRISYGDTQTVTNLSAWLKNNIITGANKQQEKFQVATEGESSSFAVSSRGLTNESVSASSGLDSAIQAVVTGSYSPLDTGVQIMLQLVSTSANRVVLSSSSFLIPAAELERRKLSLLPVQDNNAINKKDFDARQKAVASYSGSGNKWNFTATPDVLDGIYYDGDYMTMRIYSARDCYFRIIHVDVNGNTQVIYPASQSDNNFIRAGETRRIPDNTRYRLHAPFGEEMILVSAYDRQFAQSQVSGTLSEDLISRGLTVTSDNRTTMSPSATARYFYTILPR